MLRYQLCSSNNQSTLVLWRKSFLPFPFCIQPCQPLPAPAWQAMTGKHYPHFIRTQTKKLHMWVGKIVPGKCVPSLEEHSVHVCTIWARNKTPRNPSRLVFWGRPKKPKTVSYPLLGAGIFRLLVAATFRHGLLSWLCWDAVDEEGDTGVGGNVSVPVPECWLLFC